MNSNSKNDEGRWSNCVPLKKSDKMASVYETIAIFVCLKQM